MQEYTISGPGGAYRVQLDDEDARRAGLLQNKRGHAENKREPEPEVGRVPVEDKGGDEGTSSKRPGAVRRRGQ